MRYLGRVNTFIVSDGQGEQSVTAETIQEARLEAASKRWTVKAEIAIAEGEQRIARYIIEPDGTVTRYTRLRRSVR